MPAKTQFISFRFAAHEVERLQSLALPGESDSKAARRLLLSILFSSDNGSSAASVDNELIDIDNKVVVEPIITHLPPRGNASSNILDKLNALQERFEYEVRRNRASERTLFAQIESLAQSLKLLDNTTCTSSTDIYRPDIVITVDNDVPSLSSLSSKSLTSNTVPRHHLVDSSQKQAEEITKDDNVDNTSVTDVIAVDNNQSAVITSDNDEITESDNDDNEKASRLEGLTNDQIAAFDAIRAFMSEDEKYFRLTGYAGSGKSFLLGRVMGWLSANGYKFVAASPTNKAAKNLKKIAEQAGVGAEVTTVAKLLGLQPEMNTVNGKEEFVVAEESAINDYEVILVDEFSMISKENFQQLASQSGATKVIFVGDAAQLPPVGEKEPIVASHCEIESGATLNQIVRYDGEIATIAEQIRSQNQYNRVCYPFVTTNDNTVVCLDNTEGQDKIGQLFTSDEYKANPDFCRILVWRNATATKLNKLVRSYLWSDDALDYCVGDRLIARKPVFREIPITRLTGKRKKKKSEWRIILNNSEECEVSGEPTLLTSREGWDYWNVPVQFNRVGNVTLQLLTPEAEKLRDAEAKRLHTDKEWEQLNALNKRFDDCSFSYALTVHKAQGSSIDFAFIDIRDMSGCSDLQKMQYTALTRAKSKAYIML